MIVKFNSSISFSLEMDLVLAKLRYTITFENVDLKYYTFSLTLCIIHAENAVIQGCVR